MLGHIAKYHAQAGRRGPDTTNAQPNVAKLCPSPTNVSANTCMHHVQLPIKIISQVIDMLRSALDMIYEIINTINDKTNI